MADTKISALTSGNPAQSGDEIPIARTGANYKITAGSIAALASVSPAGSDTYVQFNDAGSFGADAGLAYNKTTNTLSTERVNLGTAGAASGILTLSGSTSGTVTLQPAAAAGTYTLTLPTSDGNSGEVLTTDGSGVLSWAAGGGAPGGSSGQLQYNNAGSFGGTSGITTTGTELTIASGTKTASAPVIDATQTWNNAAVTFTGLKLNVTNTASAAASLLADLQVGGTSQLSVDRDGKLAGKANANLFSVNAVNINGSLYGANLVGIGTNFLLNGANNSTGFAIGSSFPISWSSNANVTNYSDLNTVDLKLYRDAANTLAQRNGTNAQTLRVYGTYTDASNYERGKIAWSSNVLEIGVEAAGTGTNRLLRFTSPVTGASTNWEFRSTGTPSPRMVFAGTDRSVTVQTGGNTLEIINGGWSSWLDYASGAANTHALRGTNSTSSVIYFGIVGSASAVMQLNNGNGRGSGYGASMEIWEMTAPAAPGTNGVRIYAEDNGSGKTRLMALFATGAAQQIAIEP